MALAAEDADRRDQLQIQIACALGATIVRSRPRSPPENGLSRADARSDAIFNVTHGPGLSPSNPT
jgi:hypothetical protein